MVARKKRPTRGLRARAWWVLRKNKTMTLTDIQNSICTGSEKSADSNLRRWLKALVNTGLVTCTIVDDGILNSNGSNCYKLVKDVGPKPPVVREKGGVVFDPNSNQIIPPLSKGSLNAPSNSDTSAIHGGRGLEGI